MLAATACHPPAHPPDERPLEALFAPSPLDPDDKPADPRDQRLALAFWKARGVRPAWAGDVDADRLITRRQLARVSRRAAKGDAELEAMVLRVATRLTRSNRGGVQ